MIMLFNEVTNCYYVRICTVPHLLILLNMCKCVRSFYFTSVVLTFTTIKHSNTSK